MQGGNRRYANCVDQNPLRLTSRLRGSSHWSNVEIRRLGHIDCGGRHARSLWSVWSLSADARPVTRSFMLGAGTHISQVKAITIRV